jgi:MraZ protein
MDTVLDFSGSFSHSLDDKGRLALPGKLREELQNSKKPEEVTARADKDGYVVLYPYEQWLEVRAKIQAISNNASRNVAIREVIGRSERLNVDKSGRILISPALREAAGLDREVTVVGGMYKIEVWDRAKLEARRLIDATVFDDVLLAEEIPL